MRRKRPGIAGAAHHILLRGRSRQNEIESDRERQDCLNLLRRFSRAEGVRILCYCLLQQTVQAVVLPPTIDSLAGFLTRAQTAFALRSTLCAPIAPAQIWSAIRYVECKPVREGWVLRAEDYSWSSAAAHLWSVDMRRILDMEWWWQESRGLDWHSYLESFGEDEEESQISCDSGIRALPATA